MYQVRPDVKTALPSEAREPTSSGSPPPARPTGHPGHARQEAVLRTYDSSPTNPQQRREPKLARRLSLRPRERARIPAPKRHHPRPRGQCRCTSRRWSPRITMTGLQALPLMPVVGPSLRLAGPNFAKLAVPRPGRFESVSTDVAGTSSQRAAAIVLWPLGFQLRIQNMSWLPLSAPAQCRIPHSHAHRHSAYRTLDTGQPVSDRIDAGPQLTRRPRTAGFN